METKTRIHVIVRGRVQGVYFRLETQRAAENQGVFGWVKNRADGTVEAVFEGDKKMLMRLLTGVAEVRAMPSWKGSS